MVSTMPVWPAADSVVFAGAVVTVEALGSMRTVSVGCGVLAANCVGGVVRCGVGTGVGTGVAVAVAMFDVLAFIAGRPPSVAGRRVGGLCRAAKLRRLCRA